MPVISVKGRLLAAAGTGAQHEHEHPGGRASASKAVER
jgi:hypothetical protein